MLKLALFARFEAKPGKEREVENLLKLGLELVRPESSTPLWFALHLEPRVYGIFDAFVDENGREAHLKSEFAKTLVAKADDLFVAPPTIQKIDLLESKIAS